MTKPLVSIVVCCYNREHYLRQAMQSIFSQQHDPVEIVVIDDGSTDGTYDLMKSYGDKVRYFHQYNQGVVSARIGGCMQSIGEYIAFMDDDDIMPPDRVVVLYEALKQYPEAVMAVGDLAVIDAEGNYTGKRWLPKGSSVNEDPILIQDGYEAVLWPKVPAAPHTTLFRREDGQRIGWFDKQFQNASEDKDFFARLACLGPIVYVPRVVSHYRIGNESLTKNEISVACAQIQLFEKHLNLLEGSQEMLRKRLELRILLSLKKIALCKSKVLNASSLISDDFISKVIAQLRFRERVAYQWYALVKLPLRKLIRRSD